MQLTVHPYVEAGNTMCLYIRLRLSILLFFFMRFSHIARRMTHRARAKFTRKNVTLRGINLRITSRAIKSSVSSLYIYISLLVRVKHVSRMVAGEVTITFARALKTRKKEENNTRRDLSAVGERGREGRREKEKKTR